MEQQQFEALEELEALEAFLASNPNQLNNLLDKPFGELPEQLCNLGFDGNLLRHHISGLESFSKEVWIDAVGIDSIEHFLQLSPHQYCDTYPEIGAPLLVAVVNSIKISEQHAQLLEVAGGTSLSKKQKLGLEIGLPVAATVLYLAPRLLYHQNTKKQLFESLTDEVRKEVAEGNTIEIVQRVGKQENVIELKQTIFGTHMDVKLANWSDRVTYELRHTSPYIAWKSWSTRKERQASEAAKKAEKAEQKAMQAEERELANQVEHRGAEYREHLRVLERNDMETIKDDSSQEDHDILEYGGEGFSDRFELRNNWEDDRKNFTFLHTKFQERLHSRFSGLVDNEFDARASGFYDKLDGFEDEEISLAKRRASKELTDDEDAFEAVLRDEFTDEVASYKSVAVDYLEKTERAVDQTVRETVETGKELDPLKDL